MPLICRRYGVYVGFIFMICYIIGSLMLGANLHIGTDQKPDMARTDHKSKIWPDDDPDSDRIFEQLSYVPEMVRREIVIYLSPSASTFGVKLGKEVFTEQSCEVHNCLITDFTDGSHEKMVKADVVMFNRHVYARSLEKPPGQIWILYNLENPYNSPSYKILDGKLNYTATYRLDSDIVTPYERYVDEVPNDRISIMKNKAQSVRNYAAGKTKKVAWFVSNCFDENGRLAYARNLSKYIQVDIYGECGNLSCHRKSSEKCFEMLDRDYKFYLAFENANCRDYITEKFFVNALQRNIVPIVMGANRQDYARVAPKHSYIHVDDFSGPADLAKFLSTLDKDDAKYNEYFRWKENTNGGFVNTKFWCRLCALMNNPKPKIYENFDAWWRGPGVCGTAQHSTVL